MELMATPRASAIPSISGAAVPEEILSTRVRARALASSGEHAGPTHSCNATRDASGALECGTGTRCGKYTCQDSNDPENGERKSGPDRAGLGGQSHRWKKVRKVKSQVNYRSASPELPAFAMVVWENRRPALCFRREYPKLSLYI